MVAQLSRRRGRRLQDVRGGLVLVLYAELGWDLRAEMAELRLQLDLPRLALPRERVGAARRAVEPRAYAPCVRGGHVLGWDVRVVDSGEAGGPVVRAERAPGRREDRRLRLEAAGWIRVGMGMLCVRSAAGLPSARCHSRARAGILDAGKAGRA